MKQETFTDIEYSRRKKQSKRKEFWEIMDEIIPWEEWGGMIALYYLQGKRGHPPEVIYGDSAYLGIQKRSEVTDNEHLFVSSQNLTAIAESASRSASP